MKDMKDWTFLTNHGLVLLYVSQNPQCTTRQVASTINATERTVHRVLVDLHREGYIIWQRTGKGNIYQINHARGLRHELTKNSLVDDLLYLTGQEKNTKQRKSK
jgi:MarR-like DNA-binding transcriptional regulator SgrR of sgrS sRNA